MDGRKLALIGLAASEVWRHLDWQNEPRPDAKPQKTPDPKNRAKVKAARKQRRKAK